MRELDFIVTGMGGEAETSGTSLDLLRSIPYFLGKYIPPIVVINSILGSGENDAGMSGGARWEPFQLAHDEYEEISGILESDGLIKLEAPDWVRSISDWMIWIYEVDHEVPADEHRRLEAVSSEIRKRMDDAYAAGDTNKARKLELDWHEAAKCTQEFVDKHFVRKGDDTA